MLRVQTCSPAVAWRRTGAAGRCASLPVPATVVPPMPLRAGHVAAGARRQAVHQLLHVLPRVRESVCACGSAHLCVVSLLMVVRDWFVWRSSNFTALSDLNVQSQALDTNRYDAGPKR